MDQNDFSDQGTGQNPEQAPNSGFCANCGAAIEEGTRFCPECGAATPIANPIQYQGGSTVKKKLPTAAIALIAILLVGGLIAGEVLLGGRGKNDQTKPTPAATTEPTNQEGAPTSDQEEPSTTTQPSAAESSESESETVPEETEMIEPSAPETTVAEPAPTAASADSSVVSSGVQASDLGNIMNGQYYFAAEDLVFYFSFDENNLAHIYSVKNDGSDLKAIFDGFGWSLVVIDDWLYFSGNQGPAIDGTYTIFRMKFDGSQLEKINDTYSYGMFYYGGSLYYMKQSEDYQDLMTVCRANLDGTNEVVLSGNGYSPLVFNHQLYYFDNQGNMFRTKPDGSEPEVLLTASVKSYAISNGKIIYSGFDNSINICDLDGSNQQIISRSGNIPVYNVNAYGDRVFYSEYDSEFNYASYGYNYTIKSCNLDGSDQKTIFSSVSYGIYMNLVDQKLMMLDYTLANTSGAMTAEIKVMDLDGSNVSTLAR